MKICPKCNSTYTDETLNFCLTDGVPLVPQEIFDEYIAKHPSKSWQTADTLVDPRLSSVACETTVNPSSPTLEFTNSTAQNFAAPKSPKTFYAAFAVLLAALVVVGFWWFAKSPNEAGKSVLSDNTASVPKHAPAPVSPEQDVQIKKDLTDFMKSWSETNSAKNADAHMAHYANTLEVYYSESSKDKNHVLADRLRAWQKYDSVDMQVDNLKIAPESPESATVVFDKSWTMKNPQKTSTGSVQQEVHVTKTNGRWLIDGEKDLKTYFINNRENPNADNVNQSSNTPDKNTK